MNGCALRRRWRLHVPSAAVRGEWNVLLNPAHGDFRKIKIQKPQPFEFDLRMFS